MVIYDQHLQNVRKLGSPLSSLDQPSNRHDTHLKPIWKCFEWKHVKEAMPGHITNNKTEIKQATSTQRNYHHTWDTPWYGLHLSQRAQHIRYRPGLSSLGTDAIPCQIHVPHGAIDLQGFRESLKETQDIKDPGQQLQQVKSVKRLGSPLTNLDQRIDMTLTWSWSGNASNESMSKRLGLDTSPTAKLKSSKLHLPRENIIILVIPLDVCWV